MGWSCSFLLPPAWSASLSNPALTMPGYFPWTFARIWQLSQWACACMLSFTSVQLFVTLWAIACQAPLPMGILQARILEWEAGPSSRRSSQPRDHTQVSYISCIGRWVLHHYHHLGSPHNKVSGSIFSYHECFLSWGLPLTGLAVAALLLCFVLGYS